MASYPPPPPGYDPRDQRRYLRDQARMQRDAIRAQAQQFRYQMRGLRRGSILGPILLIAVGIVFLLIQTGHLSHQVFWDWYGRSWPLLLIGAGLILLAEWAFDQYHLRDPQQPQYRRSVGGGIFTLLIVFAIAGGVAREARLHGNVDQWFPGWHFGPDDLDQFLGDKHESDQTLEVALPANGSLSVSNPHGDVTISGVSEDNRIHLAVHKQVYTRSDSEADSKAAQLTPAISSGQTVSISMPTLEGARADLVITLPISAALNVTANHGDIHIASIRNSVGATANHGDIELSAITGPVTAHINSHDASISARSLASSITIEGHAGDVTLTDITGPATITGEFFGTTHLERIAAPIHFHTSRTDFQLARLDGEVEISPDSELTANSALGPVVLTTHNRNITLDRIAGDVSVTNRNGSIELTSAPISGGAAIGNVTVEDRNGSVHVTVPDHAAFSVQANTTNGSIETGLTLESQAGPQNDGSHTTLTGTSGIGGPRLVITTTNADIALNKSTILPIPPTPPAPPKLTLAPPVPPSAPTTAHNAKSPSK